MNEESVKIAKIKKSCRVGKNVSLVLFVLCLIFSVLTLVASIKMALLGAFGAFLAAILFRNEKPETISKQHKS